MKKLLALALAAIMLFTLAACGEQPAPSDPTPADNAESTTASSAPEEPTADPALATGTPDSLEATPMAMEEMVLVDDENCTFTINSASENPFIGMTISATCVNKTDKTLCFTWNTVSFCGYMYDPLWSQAVAPGGTVESVIYIDTYDLEQLGITSVDEISFTLYIFDQNDFMAEPFVDAAYTIYPTGLDAETVTYPERAAVDGEQVIADSEGVDFIIESFEETDSRYILRCYLGNQTDVPLMFSWDAVAVNGCAIDPVWSMEVSAGKRAYAEIVFYRSDLTENEIEAVEEIDFTLLVNNWADWEADPILEQSSTFRAEDSAVG